MPRLSTITLLAVLAAALASAGCSGKKEATAAEAAGEQPAFAAEPYEPEAPAKAATAAAGNTLLEARCTGCHDLERVQKKKDDAEGWAKTVDRMRKKGAKLDDAERAAVVSYLAENYGK
jgi:cytochrome c5